jgi:WD40 repeat protein
VLAAAASLLAVFALILRGRARDDARVATARQLAASAEANLNVDPERSILLGIEAAKTTQRHDGTILPEAQQALHDGLTASRVLARSAGVGRRSGIGHVVALAPDAATFVAADLDHETVSIRDAHTGKRLATLPGHSAEVLAVGYSSDGRFIAAGDADGATRLWNATTRKLVRALRPNRAAVFATVFSADGRRLATVSGDRALRVWDARSGRLRKTIAKAHNRTAAPVVWGEGVAFVGENRIAVAPWSRGKGAPSPVVARVFDVSTG